MCEEEKNQCQCEGQCQCGENSGTLKLTTAPYDICAMVFCVFPVLAELFTIDFHNPTNIVQTSIKALILSLFPLIISIIGISEKERKNDTSHMALTAVIIIDVIYAMILLIGFLDGGKLFS